MSLRPLLATARADARERMRRPSFLVMIGLAIYLGYTVKAGYWAMRLSGYRSELNSAYVGAMTALLSGLLLSWIGFFLVKNAIEGDRSTRVGEILASTPIGKGTYVLAKALSNFVVLASMVLVLALAALLTAFSASSGAPVELGVLVVPFVLFTLPAVALTAAMAVFFEAVPGLRAGVGNVVWLLLWGAVFFLSVEVLPQHFDFSGFRLVYESQREVLVASYPDASVTGMGFQIGPRRLDSLFHWNGVAWTAAAVGQRLLWFPIAALVAIAAAVPFDRFGSSRRDARTEGRVSWGRLRLSGLARRQTIGQGGAPAASDPWQLDASALRALAESRAPRRQGSQSRLFFTELKLLMRGQAWWWYAALLGLAVAQILVPEEALRSGVLSAVWIWPILVWSAMGCRDRIHGTEDLMDSAPRPVLRQLSATWLAGVAVAALTSSPAVCRLLWAGRPDLAAAILAAMALVPSLALCLGIWSGTPRLFEVLYFFLWYLGPVNRVPALDYLGGTDQALELGTPAWATAAALALLVAAAVGKSRR